MFYFNPISSAQLDSLRRQYYTSLNAPLDGMWDDLIHRAVTKGIFYEHECIGYFCHDQAYTLINFFLADRWLNHKQTVITHLLQDEYFPQAYVSTNHPCFLTAVLPLVRRTSVYYYLFEEGPDFDQAPTVPPPYQDTELRIADHNDLNILVDFCYKTSSVDKAWLTEYTRHWIEREGMYYLTRDQEIVGTLELRKSHTQPGYADLGAIVSPKHRKQGLGTYLMKKGRTLCYQKGFTSICSCRFDNKGSRRMIENAGFVNKHLMLRVKFNM
jgi:GNAT superfamily N-acetyltransferase